MGFRDLLKMKKIEIEMEIPKNCRECPMNQGEYSPDKIEKRYCCLTHKAFSKKDYKKRQIECPLKEVINDERVRIKRTVRQSC